MCIHTYVHTYIMYKYTYRYTYVYICMYTHVYITYYYDAYMYNLNSIYRFTPWTSVMQGVWCRAGKML